MKTTISTLSILLVLSTFASAQPASGKATTPSRPQISGTTEGRQWEYLVVSFGKVYFSDPISDTDIKTSGLSKLISFSKAGIVIASEGVTTQSKMDTLGKFGWELVGVVGAIGGDQEMLFKRPYLPERSKQEEELIKAEGERAKSAIEEERRRNAQAPPANVLVDLDEFDRIAARDANRKAEEDRLKVAVQSVQSNPITVKSIFSAASNDKDSNVIASVIVDGTSKLLTDGNKYRSGAANNLAKAVGIEIFNAAKLRQKYGYGGSLEYIGGSVTILVSVVINFNGTPKEVGSAIVSGDWPK